MSDIDNVEILDSIDHIKSFLRHVKYIVNEKSISMIHVSIDFEFDTIILEHHLSLVQLMFSYYD